MDLFMKLADVFTSTSSPPVERTLAEALMRVPDVISFLSGLTKARMVVVITGGIPKDIYMTFLNQSYQDFLLFPTPVLEVLSSSPALTARLASSTACSLITMLIGNNNGFFKGVLALTPGVSLDDLSFPGALIWTLEKIPRLVFPSETYTIVVSSAFTGYTIVTPHVTSLVLGPFPSEGEKEIRGIAAKGREVFRSEMNTRNKKCLIDMAIRTLPYSLRIPTLIKCQEDKL